MVLDISTTDVGFDESGAKQFIQDIEVECVDKAKTHLKDNLATLNSAVDEVWQGKSADNFKSNMDKDVKAIIDALDKSYAAIVGEINQTLKAMENIDQNLVTKR